MIAAGFICYTGISKNIFENDFLKNLCYTLHWQSPSLYTIQKRISDSSKRLYESCFNYLARQASVTLIVYLWTDISKRCSISFAACSPSGMICFLSYVQCKQESWSVSFINQQCQDMIQVLQQHQIHVGLVYFDDYMFFDTMKNALLWNNQFLPITGNTIAWCSELLSSLFTYPSFMATKQNVERPDSSSSLDHLRVCRHPEEVARIGAVPSESASDRAGVVLPVFCDP